MCETRRRAVTRSVYLLPFPTNARHVVLNDGTCSGGKATLISRRGCPAPVLLVFTNMPGILDGEEGVLLVEPGLVVALCAEAQNNESHEIDFPCRSRKAGSSGASM